MRTYTTLDGDMLDAIVWKAYGRCDRYLEAVLEANPHLLDRYVLPAGLTVNLPDVEPEPDSGSIRLWGNTR
ncbi:MAG: tail protein X [Devosia sp.]